MAVKSLGKAFQAFSDEGQKFLDRVLNRDAPEVSFEDEYYDVPVPAKAKEQGYSEQKFTHVGPKGLMEYDLDAERANAGLSPEGIYAGFKDPDKAKKYADRLREKGIDPEEYELTTTGRSVFVLGADKPNEKMVEAFDYVLRNKVPNAGEDYYQGKIDTFRKSGAMDIDMSRKNKSDVFRYGGAEALLDGEDFVFLKPEQVREVGADFEKSKIGQSGLFKTLAPTAVALGLVSTPEEAEAAYIPLKAFAEGSDAAKALFEKAMKRIDEGADTRPNGELYNEMAVYKSEDGDLKVDVAELSARNAEQLMGLKTFKDDIQFYLNSPKKRSTHLYFPITRYLGEDSPIFKNFPDLKEMTVELAPRSRAEGYNDYKNQGFYLGPHPKNNYKPKLVITIPTSDKTQGIDLSKTMSKADVARQVMQSFNTFIHEFQHYIQDVKKASSVGYNSKYSKDALKGFKKDYKDAVKFLKKANPEDEGYDLAQSKVNTIHQMVADALRSNEKANKFFGKSLQEQSDFSIKLLDEGKLHPRVSAEIALRELGEAEARSSALKAFLPEGSERNAIGIFYPSHRNETNTILQRLDDIPTDFQIENNQVLVRAFPETAYPTAADKLSFPDDSVLVNPVKDAPAVAEKKKASGDSTRYSGPALTVGGGTAAGLASPPSEAFVSEIGERTGLFEDGSPTPSLFDVEGVSDELGITNTFLLDLLAPRTKPYDLISNIPVVGEAMMGADLLQGLGSPDAETPDEFSDKERDVAGLRQGGGLETEAGKEMEEDNPNKPIPEKADINKDGKIQAWEKARHEAIMKTDEKKTAMYEGGMMADPFAPLQVVIGIDEDSGNEIPAGSKPEEVRDDIPAMLSEGEYVVPADVVRYHGLKTFEALRSEAKCALGLMAQHDRISMVDDETKEPVEYDIEEKDAPEVEEAEVKVVEAAEGTDVQASPVASAFYQLRYITDPVTGETRMAYVDPTTGLEVTEETYDPAKANRYSIENILSREVSPEEEAEEEKEEPKEVESTLGTEEVFPRRSDEDGGATGQRMTRDLGNNYGYTTEGLGSKLGPFSGPLAFADNVNNAAAVSQARQNLGLDGLGFLGELGAGFTGQYNDGFVGEIQVGGINYGVTLGDTGGDYGPLGSRVDRVISAKEADALNFTVGQDSPFDAMETSNEPVTTSTTPIETGDGDKSFGIEGADYQADRSFGIEGEGYGATSDSGFTDDYGYDYGTGYGDAENEDAFESVSTDQDDTDRERNESIGLNKGGYATRKNKPRVAMMKY